MRYILLLCILPLLVAGSAASKTNVELDKRKDTIERMETIKKALDSFAVAYGRVPCPADSNLGIDNTNFGKELLDGADCGSDAGQTTGDVMAGAVPVRTLLLPDSLMFDGWGRRVAYVVDQRFAGKGDFQQELTNASIAAPLTSYHFTINSAIEVRDTIGGILLNGGTNDRTVGVLVSYGQNGKGAFTRQGVALDVGNDADELENNGGGGSFNTLFIKKKPTASFDDVVVTIERNEAVALHCLGVDVPSRTGGHTPAGDGYPEYDWPNAAAGATETQACSDEYTGTIARACDANGEWQPIVSTCNCATVTLTDNTSYGGIWPNGDNIGTTIGDSHTLTEAADNICLPGFDGSVTALCQSAGGWGVNANNCAP